MSSIRRYEPVNMLSRLQSEINDFFRAGEDRLPSLFQDSSSLLSSTGWTPRIDIKEDQNHYTVTADVPGVDPKDIQVTMANGMLTIKCERKFAGSNGDPAFRDLMGVDAALPLPDELALIDDDTTYAWRTYCEAFA